MKLSKIASAMPFAHYLGLSGSAARMEEGDDPDERKQRDGESDDDYAKRMEELDQKEEDARRAEEEEKERARKAEEDEKEKARRAAADDDDPDAEDEKDEKASAARQRERIRCARIVAAGVKAGRTNLACSFAFDSSLTAAQAEAAIAAAGMDDGAKQRSGLGQRMATAKPQANPGIADAPPNPDSAKAVAAQIVEIGSKFRR